MVELSMASAQMQPAIHEQPFQRWAFADGTPWTEFYRTAPGYLLRFPSLADFAVSADGRSVTCHPAPSTSVVTTEHLFHNQVVPLALSRQGKLVFHASAVEVAGRALAFVGASGRGKSTLAACFATAGGRLLTDDGLILDEDAGGHRVVPTQPSIRLWDDSKAALFAGRAEAPALPFTSKARFLVDAFCTDARPLHRVYFLGTGEAATASLAPLSARDALVELVRHSFLLDTLDRSMLAKHFEQVAALAMRPIHHRLDYPRRFDELARVRACILEDLAREDVAA